MREIKIENRFNGEIIVCGKYKNIFDCVEKNKANLRGADLWEANLWGADLRGADLREANLRGANLWRADLREANLWGADLRRANLREANLWEADLRGANLRGADLWEANLRGADLRRANLREANLRGADLWRADLREAKCKEPLFLCDLYSLKLLPKNTVLTFWKYLQNGCSPYQGMGYEVGEEYKFKNFDENENNQCGEGCNVATLMWCLKDNLNANEFIEVEFKVKDIVAIPYITDGKFRVNKIKVLRKINRKQAIKLLKNIMNGG